jgi:hypothetical protein
VELELTLPIFDGEKTVEASESLEDAFTRIDAEKCFFTVLGLSFGRATPSMEEHKLEPLGSDVVYVD